VVGLAVVVALGRNDMVVVGPNLGGEADDDEEKNGTGFEGSNGFESERELELGSAFGFVFVTTKPSDETPEPAHNVL
jgi:hypothetical protein